MKKSTLISVMLVTALLSGCGNGRNGDPLPDVSNNPPITDPTGNAPDDADSADDSSNDDMLPITEPQAEEPPADVPPVDESPNDESPVDEPPPSNVLAGLKLIEPADAKRLTPAGKMVFAVDQSTDITQIAKQIQLRNTTDTSILPIRTEVDEVLRTLTILPVRQLEVGSRYSIEMKQSVHGPLMALSTGDVSAVHVQVPDLVVTKHVFYNQDGAISAVILVQESDISSLPAYINLEGPGEDGEWLKGNDDVRHYRMKSIDDDFGSYTEIEYRSPGEGGQWFDDNDVEHHAIRYVFHASGALKMFAQSASRGSDGDWFSNDDEYYDFLVVDLDENGRPLKKVTASSLTEAGTDKTWFTEDDQVSGYLQYEYDDRGFRTRLISFDSPGDNGVWYSSDDGVEEYHTYRYTAQGRLEFDITVSGPGADGKWLDENDVTRDFYRYANTYHSIESDLTSRRDYFFATTDIPLSEDLIQLSTLHHYVIRLHDAAGRPTFGGRMTERGPNQRWFDTDDSFDPGDGGYARETFYTPMGDSIESVAISYSAPGEDDLWRTGNEPIDDSSYEVLDSSGRRIYLESYRTPGDDGDWLRRADNPLRYTVEYDVEFED